MKYFIYIRKKLFLIALFVSSTINLFSQKKNADLLIYNAKIYTVDQQFSVATAIAIKNGKIEDVGDSKNLQAKYNALQSINAEGKFIYPGFIDAHAHFYRYSLGLSTANLVNTDSWEDIVNQLQSFAKQNPDGWLIGRGWDQNDWQVKEFPTKEKLDQLFPDRPVLLSRVDGHAAVANQKALDIAGIQPGQTISGGVIEMKNGKLTGILIDNAVDLVSKKIPEPSLQQITKSLQQGQQNCFAVGLTTVDDPGLDYHEVLLMDSLQKKNILKMRVFAMLSDATQNYNFLLKNGKIKTDRLNVRSFKVYADGALGSRGACLLLPYNDRPDWNGFLLSSQQHFDSVANIISQHGFQMCTHAIGDSGNRTMLMIYAKYLKEKNDQRWRIEHAQVINENDFKLFGDYNIIPSVQPTHATSDMYWAKDRLGKQRMKGAYAYKELLDENGWIPLGTDFPVEDISPFKTFHSAVFRTDVKEFPEGGFQKENALSREEALKGITLWAAKSNFEENEKGSLEKGKFADFVILDTDLMTTNASDILKTTVLATYSNGEKVYQKQ